MRSPTGRHQVLLRSLLSLLLLVMPLMSQAGVPHMQTRGTGPEPAAEMPCHMQEAGDSVTVDTVDDACPHCQEGNLLKPCPCCSVAVPAAIPGLEVSVYLQMFRLVVRQRVTKDSLPPAHRDRLFRPPILSA